MQQASPLLIEKKKTAKKPIGHNLGGCNLRRHKLRKWAIRLGTLNVQGIRNKTGEIIKSLVQLKEDITTLTETKRKGNEVEILGPYLHFYSGFPKEKRAKRRVFILVKRDIRNMWCGRKVMRLIFLTMNFILLQIKVIPFKIVPLGSYTATEALFPSFVAVLEGFYWNTFQPVGCARLDIIQSTKMAPFQVVFEPGE